MSPVISNMGTYFDSLAPVFKKNDLKIDLEHNFEELTQTILPMYSLTQPILNGKTVKASAFYFNRLILSYKDSTYDVIKNTLVSINANEDALVAIINTAFEAENHKAIIDYYQLNLLKYLSAITYFNDFSRMWMNAALSETVNATRLKDGILTHIVSPTITSDIEFVNTPGNIETFATIVNMLQMPVAKYVHTIQHLQGHVFNSEDWSKTSSDVTHKLDPNHFVAPRFNLFYITGLLLNGWRLKRHERNKADFARFQLMLMELEQQKTDTVNPDRIGVLDKQINYYSNLSNKISAQIENMEGD